VRLVSRPSPGAAGAGIALCCTRGRCREVDAAGALQQIAAVVAILRSCGDAPERARCERTASSRTTLGSWARSELRTSAPMRRPPSGRRSILSKGKLLMSTILLGALDVELHQVDEIRAAGDKSGRWAPSCAVETSHCLDGLCKSRSSIEPKLFHVAAPCGCVGPGTGMTGLRAVQSTRC